MPILSRFPVRFVFLSLILIFAISCAPKKQAEVPELEHNVFEGVASWYGVPFHGRLMANGKRFDMNKPTAAHRTLPFGTKVKVINLSNEKSTIVTITDRGPFIKGRILDVSRKTAQDLDFLRSGTARIRMVVLGDNAHLTSETHKSNQD